MTIVEWLELNQLQYVWLVEPRVFVIDDVSFVVVEPKGGKLFDEHFDVILDDADLELIEQELPKYLCFQFGRRYYYSAVGEPVKFNQLKYIGEATQRSFPYLGIHGGYELCNGSGSYEDWVKKAKFLGVDTLGVCERNTLAGTLKFQEVCKKQGVKSILGETVVVKDQATNQYLVKLYCVDEVGWHNLLWINKAINVDNEGKYVDETYLLERTGGLIVVLGSDVRLTDELMAKYSSSELYYQLDTVEWKANDRDKRHLDNLKHYYDKYFAFVSPLLICDSYYLDQQDYGVKEFLNSVGKVGFENQSEDQYFKTSEVVESTLMRLFSDLDGFLKFYDECLLRLTSVVNKCQFKIKTGSLYLPRYELTVEEQAIAKDDLSLFWCLIEEGLGRKVIEPGKDVDTYLTRVELEHEVIDSGKLQPYFLILQDIVRWAKRQGILVGRGRGSIGGSLISNLIDITDVDPLEFGLLFERFLNKGRIATGSFPDIDTDFEASRRDEVKRYIEQRYGLDNVCSIGTYGTFKLKAAVKDACRLMGVHPGTANYYSAMLEESGVAYEELFKEAVQNSKFKEFLQSGVEYVDVLPTILGQPKNASIHAAGIVITPKELDGRPMTIYDWMPVKKVNGLLVSEWEGPLLEKAGFLKEDVLGLTELDKFSDTLKLIEASGKEVPDLNQIDLTEPEVFELFKQGFTQDVFQFNTRGLTSYCRDVRPDSVEELGAMNALYRPGPMSSDAHNDYVKIKFGRKEPEYDWGTENVFKATRSLYVYQEQIMNLFQELAGFSLAEADSIRSAIGKKDMEKMLGFKTSFIARSIERGCPEQEANKIWNKIWMFGQYGFNKAHAITYSILGYTGQWLKCHYPVEFWAVALHYSSDDDLPAKVHEVMRHGLIKLVSPDVNKSGVSFIADVPNNTIYWSLNKVRQVGEVATRAILDERVTKGNFYSLTDFLARVNKSKVNRRCVVNLILAGAFDEVECIVNVRDRKVLLVRYLQSLHEEVPVEFLGSNTTKEWFWYVQQRAISGSGEFDFQTLMSSVTHQTQAEYCMPHQLELTDNLGKSVIVFGLVMSVVTKTSKKGEFGHLVLDHNNAVIEVTVWSEAWTQYKTELMKSVGTIIGISGLIVFDKWRKKNVVHTQQDTFVHLV